jgi:hypothetical protein
MMPGKSGIWLTVNRVRVPPAEMTPGKSGVWLTVNIDISMVLLFGVLMGR